MNKHRIKWYRTVCLFNLTTLSTSSFASSDTIYSPLLIACFPTGECFAWELVGIIDDTLWWKCPVQFGKVRDECFGVICHRGKVWRIYPVDLETQKVPTPHVCPEWRDSTRAQIHINQDCFLKARRHLATHLFKVCPLPRQHILAFYQNGPHRVVRTHKSQQHVEWMIPWHLQPRRVRYRVKHTVSKVFDTIRLSQQDPMCQGQQGVARE